MTLRKAKQMFLLECVAMTSIFMPRTSGASHTHSHL